MIAVQRKPLQEVEEVERPKHRVAIPRDIRVAAAIQHLVETAEWPYWFAKNIVLARKERGLMWDTWGVAR